MNQIGPQIGFDRFIHRDWICEALQVRAGLSEMKTLNDLLDSAHSGAAAKKKTRTVLNRLWLEPRAELLDYADRGIEIYKSAPDTSVTVLSWGMAIATYPFFGRVAEIVGRLTAIQGDCASAEVHRRMSEIFGEREGTYRMTNMVLQSQASWGAVERIENGKRLLKHPKLAVDGNQASAWLVEGCLRYVGRPLSVQEVEFLPVIFPFTFQTGLAQILSHSSMLELRTEGQNKQVIGMR